MWCWSRCGRCVLRLVPLPAASAHRRCVALLTARCVLAPGRWQSERAEAQSLGLPSRIDPDRATGVDFADRQVRDAASPPCARGSAPCARGSAPRSRCACEPVHDVLAARARADTGGSAPDGRDRQALGSWLKHTGLHQTAASPAPGVQQHAAKLRQLHALSTAKRARMKVVAPARTQKLTNSGVPAPPVPGTITVAMPTGYSVRTGKKISGILDIAAPLDPDTGSAVPGIVVPNGAPGGTTKGAQLRKIQAYTNAGIGKSDMSPALAAQAAMRAARDGAQSSMLAQQQPQQLAEMPQMADNEDMYPNTDAQQYDYISNQPVQYPVPQEGQSQVYTANGGPAVTQSVTSPWVQNPQSWEVTGSYPPAGIYTHISNPCVCIDTNTYICYRCVGAYTHTSMSMYRYKYIYKLLVHVLIHPCVCIDTNTYISYRCIYSYIHACV